MVIDDEMVMVIDDEVVFVTDRDHLIKLGTCTSIGVTKP